MADFINEVEEELRKDEYNKLLKKWGPFLLGIIIAIIAVTGYIEWQKAVADKASRATSAAYVQASNLFADGKGDAAYGEFLAISEKAPAGYAGLSLVRAAAIKLDEGATMDAVTLFDKAAQKFETPRHKQLAQLKAAYILANQGQFDDVLSRLGPLAEKDQPYEYLAKELIGFAALQKGDLSKARAEFQYLASIPGVPDSIQSRAQQNMAIMAVDSMSATPEETVIPQNETPPAEGNEEPENE